MFILVFITVAITFTIISRFDLTSYLNLFGNYTVNYKQFAPLYSNTGTYKLRIPLHEPNWEVTLPSDDYTISPNVANTEYCIDSITIQSNQNWVNVSGWMFDGNTQTDFKYILIEINGTYYPMIKTNGQDVAEYYQLNNIKECRFNGVIPKQTLQTGENNLVFIGVHANKIDYALIKHTFFFKEE